MTHPTQLEFLNVSAKQAFISTACAFPEKDLVSNTRASVSFTHEGRKWSQAQKYCGVLSFQKRMQLITYLAKHWFSHLLAPRRWIWTANQNFFPINMMTPFEMDTVGSLPPLAVCCPNNRQLKWVRWTEGERSKRMHLLLKAKVASQWCLVHSWKSVQICTNKSMCFFETPSHFEILLSKMCLSMFTSFCRKNICCQIRIWSFNLNLRIHITDLFLFESDSEQWTRALRWRRISYFEVWSFLWR